MSRITFFKSMVILILIISSVSLQIRPCKATQFQEEEKYIEKDDLIVMVAQFGWGSSCIFVLENQLIYRFSLKSTHDKEPRLKGLKSDIANNLLRITNITNEDEKIYIINMQKRKLDENEYSELINRTKEIDLEVSSNKYSALGYPDLYVKIYLDDYEQNRTYRYWDGVTDEVLNYSSYIGDLLPPIIREREESFFEKHFTFTLYLIPLGLVLIIGSPFIIVYTKAIRRYRRSMSFKEKIVLLDDEKILLEGRCGYSTDKYLRSFKGRIFLKIKIFGYVVLTNQYLRFRGFNFSLDIPIQSIISNYIHRDNVPANMYVNSLLVKYKDKSIKTALLFPEMKLYGWQFYYDKILAKWVECLDEQIGKLS